MNSSGLVARKRGQHDDIEQRLPQAPDSGGVRRTRSSSRHRFFPDFLQSDLGRAIEAIVAFLLAGLFLGFFMLHHQHRKVVLQIMANPRAHVGAALRGRVGFRHHFYYGNPRTVTVVMPSVVNTAGRRKRLDSIFETWGPAARAVYVVHNVSEFPQGHHDVIGDGLTPEDPYSYPQLLLVPPSIPFDEGLPRLNYVIRAVYDKINPDFAFFVNDHTYVIPEHLCKYLEHRNASEDMYEGHAMKNDAEVFNSGAAGYLLSRETMKKLVDKWDSNDKDCLTNGGPAWLQGNPGLATAKCLKESLNVVATDTRQHGKWHRFHAFPITRLVAGTVDDWYKKKHKGMHEMMTTDESYNTLLSGVDCCATDTISFHYVEYRESRALFATREALLKNPRMTDRAIKSLMTAEWPREFKEIGGYSRGLPKEADSEGWTSLINLLRKLSSRHTQGEC